MEHWRKYFENNYLGVWDIPEKQTLTVKITGVEYRDVVDFRGNTTKKMCVLVEGYKPLICNRTNAKDIAAMHGQYVEKWTGKTITLYTKYENAFGEVKRVLRVQKPPRKLQTVQTGTEAWNKIVDAVKKGFTIAEIATKYRLSDKQLNILQQI